MSVSTLSRNLVRRTTNGGRSWVTLARPSVPYDTLSFVDSRHGWASRRDRVLRTANGGASWRRCGATTIEDVFRVDFVSRSTGWAAGLWGVEKTTDGGRTWHMQLKEWRNGGSALLAQSPSVVWSCGIGGERSDATWPASRAVATAGSMPYFGTLRRSTDGGSSWKTIGVADAYRFDAVGVRCWAVCRLWNGDSYILRSENRGDSWTRL
jgi:photosystem II stability/assembly factor-like uncharacterized protein